MLIIRKDNEDDLLRMSQSSGLNSQVDVQVIVTAADKGDVDKLEYQKPAYVAVALIMAITLLTIFFPMLVTSSLLGMTVSIYGPAKPTPCIDHCRISIVESIPENLTYPAGSPVHPSTYTAWMSLLDSAQDQVDMAVFYWSLRGDDIYKDPSDWQGEAVFKKMLETGRDRGVDIRIAQSTPQSTSNQDSQILAKEAKAQVRELNMTRWFGAGVQHAKLIVVDQKHFYVGSANMDWRSLTQVKELGILVQNCPCLTKDMAKIFDVFWYMGQANATVPRYWPYEYSTNINNNTALPLYFNQTPAEVYISSSPPAFCPKGRTTDIDAILDIIHKADKYVHIAVMDYAPAIVFTKHKRFWAVIDDALRTVALEKKVEVRLLCSNWSHTAGDMLNYLHSLAALQGVMQGASIQVKLFIVPASEEQKKIPYARVNHNKYMVTDQVAYIGTSNWSGDYFTSTGGIGVVVNQTSSTNSSVTTVQQQLEAVFQRDWNSSYAVPLSTILKQYGVQPYGYTEEHQEL